MIPEILLISYFDIYFIYFSRITRDVFTSSLSVMFSYLFMSVFFYFKHFAQCFCLFGMCVYVCVAMCVRERERHSGGLSVSGSVPNDTLSSLWCTTVAIGLW